MDTRKLWETHKIDSEKFTFSSIIERWLLHVPDTTGKLSSK